MMNYKIVNQPLQNREILNSTISCVNKNNITELNFLSKESYNLTDKITISEETFISSIYNNEIILYHFNKPGYFLVNIDKKEKKFIKSSNVPEFAWGSGVVLNLDREKRIYKCLIENNKEVFVFEPKYPISNQWFESGILFFENNEKEKNWIKCFDPNGGKVKWEIEFTWQFVRIETYKNLIVLDYQAFDSLRKDKGYEGERDWYNPKRYTIVLCGETGKELWRHPFTYSKIDYNNEIILSENDGHILEIEIRSGIYKCDIYVNQPKQLSYHPHFTDNKGVYYITNESSFGKINKMDGSIEWEFDLIDNKGEKRKLSDWILLGNGSLVLQAIANHPNGELTCIFNPNDNLDFSKVNNGKKTPPASTRLRRVR